MTIGLVATLSIEVQNAAQLEQVSISQVFMLPSLILQDACLAQMKLTSVILAKMDKQERATNEFAVKLQERIDRFRQEFDTGAISFSNRVSVSGEDSQTSEVSCDTDELEELMTRLLTNQSDLLERQCSEKPLPSSQQELYSNLLAIAFSEITELNVAKDIIANEVNSIQETVQVAIDQPASLAQLNSY